MKGYDLEMFGNNRSFAFISALDHKVQESGGCKSDTLLAFSQFKMAAKMAAEYGNCYISFELNHINSYFFSPG